MIKLNKWSLFMSTHLYKSFILALMLSAFTTRRMLGSAYLALSPIRFTAQFDIAVLDIYSYEKIHKASLVRRDELISALVTTSSPRLKART